MISVSVDGSKCIGMKGSRILISKFTFGVFKLSLSATFAKKLLKSSQFFFRRFLQKTSFVVILPIDLLLM